MAIHYATARPPPFQVQVGDVYVNRNTGVQELYTATGWVAITARADVLPPAGASEQHLARGVANNPFASVWVVPSDGMVFQYERPTASASNEWEVTHELRSRWVDVTVVSPGNNDPTAEQTKLIPRIVYSNEQRCVLHFARPVSGTALIRR